MDLLIPVLAAVAFAAISWAFDRRFRREVQEIKREAVDQLSAALRRERLLRVELGHANRRAARRGRELGRRQADDLARKRKEVVTFDYAVGSDLGCTVSVARTRSGDWLVQSVEYQPARVVRALRAVG